MRSRRCWPCSIARSSPSRDAFDRVGGLLAVYEENARLREENRRLLGWQAEAARLAVQNRSLQRMLAVPTVDHPAARLTARVVGNSGGAFVQALLLDAGAEQGVTRGMPATTPEGLVGRVIDVGRAQRPCPADHRLQLAHPGRGGELGRPRAPGRRQLPAADPALPAAQARLRHRRSRARPPGGAGCCRAGLAVGRIEARRAGPACASGRSSTGRASTMWRCSRWRRRPCRTRPAP